MTQLKVFPQGPNGRKGLPGDVDGLLRYFLRSEMPEPWPDWKPPVEPMSPQKKNPARWLGLSRSHLALAASLLLMLVGSWSLSGIRTEAVPVFGGTERG